jgi:trehalose-6-phosphate synthase
MNLVAKEFVAARHDESGVLVLSELTGAAQELRDAEIINPYDTERFAGTIARAIEMPFAERRLHMRELRRLVAGRNVFVWASEILDNLDRLTTTMVGFAQRLARPKRPRDAAAWMARPADLARVPSR